METMIVIMGLFLIVVSALKMGDWNGFVHAFGMYDVIASRSRVYATVYPLIEFSIGVLFVSGWFVKEAAAALLFLMVVGLIGVTKNLMKKEKIRCACLGTFINVPLTKFTLVEDIVMAVMAIIILVS